MSSSNKSIAFWLVTGCGVMAAAGIAFFVAIFVIVLGSMRSSAPYKDALRTVRADDRARTILGTPIEAGYFSSGSISTTNTDGNVDLTIPVSGPKGKGSVHIRGTKTNGRWSYSQLELTPKTGPPIDLLPPLRKATPGG
jgi:hypothetical protein